MADEDYQEGALLREEILQVFRESARRRRPKHTPNLNEEMIWSNSHMTDCDELWDKNQE